MHVYYNVYSTDTLKTFSRKKWENFGYKQLTKLYAFLGYPVDKHTETSLRKYYEYREFNRGDDLFHEGKLINDLYFIIDGGVMITKTQSNKGIIVNLCGAGELVASVDSFYYNEPSVITAKVIKKTRVLVITKGNLVKSLSHPANDNMKELIYCRVSDMGLRFHKDLTTFLALRNNEKISKATSMFPTMFQTFPLKIIADFLGMKPESLSRLRNNQPKKILQRKNITYQCGL